MLIRLGYDIRFEIGQPVPIVIERDGRRVTLSATPAARK